MLQTMMIPGYKKNFSYVDHFGFDPPCTISVDREAIHNTINPCKHCAWSSSPKFGTFGTFSMPSNIWNIQLIKHNCVDYQVCISVLFSLNANQKVCLGLNSLCEDSKTKK